MKWFILFLSFLFVLNAMAMTPEERAKRREELHQQMRERMLNGFGQNPDATMREMERLMDELMSDSMREIESLQRQGFMGGSALNFGPRAGVTTDWTENSEGRVLTVTPEKPETKMDVQVLNGIVTIKSEVATSNSKSQFSRTQIVPGDCDGDRVKMDAKDGKLTLLFPWKKSAPRPDNERKPLKSSSDKIDV